MQNLVWQQQTFTAEVFDQLQKQALLQLPFTLLPL